MQIKHDEAPEESCSYKHKCEYCHKLFRDRPKLEGHRRIHTGEKPFFCEICGNNYALKGSLRTHIKQKHDNYVKINNYEYCLKLFRVRTKNREREPT